MSAGLFMRIRLSAPWILSWLYVLVAAAGLAVVEIFSTTMAGVDPSGIKLLPLVIRWVPICLGLGCLHFFLLRRTLLVRNARGQGTEEWVKALASADGACDQYGVIVEQLTTGANLIAAHAALAESESRLRRLVESALDVIVTVDSDGTVL